MDGSGKKLSPLRYLIFLLPLAVLPFLVITTKTPDYYFLSKRGVQVTATVTHFDPGKREITYRYEFNGVTYNHSYNFVGEATSFEGKERTAFIDPEKPERYSLIDPNNLLWANIRMIIFLEVVLIIGCFVKLLLPKLFPTNPFTESDEEFRQKWKMSRKS